MTISIGLRAAPTAVYFALYDSEKREIFNVERLRVPSAFEVPNALKFVRANILDVLLNYDVRKAGVRTIEPTAQTKDVTRIHIEGVIQEAFASSDLEGFFAGPIAVMASKLGIAPREFKPIRDGRNDFDIPDWDKFSPEEAEAVLAALGAQNV